MKRTGFWVGLVVVLVSLTVLAIAVAGSRSTSLKTYSPDDPNRPKISLDQEVFDLGEIEMEGVYEHIFTFKNQGERPLELKGFRTSCDCTTAKVKIGEQESPEFGMHNPPQWRGEVEPGKEGEIKVIYEPRLHPVEGKVERAVLFETNDPENAQIVLTIKAEVKK